MGAAGKDQGRDEVQRVGLRVIQIPAGKGIRVKMDMAKGADMVRFQVEGVHRVRRDQNKITGGTQNLPAADVHGTAAGPDQINFDGFVDVLGKAVSVFSQLFQSADDGLGAQENFLVFMWVSVHLLTSLVPYYTKKPEKWTVFNKKKCY